MRNHVGKHILHSLRDIEDPVGDLQQHVGIEPCGFCGLDACLTQLQQKNGKNTIIPNCSYHYSGMNYKAASEFSTSAPCTNVPITCPLCPKSPQGDAHTIWKYNALFHLACMHSDNTGALPEIPIEFLLKIFITKREESSLGISEEATEDWRLENEIPGSDDLEVLKNNYLKRHDQAQI